MKKLKKADYIIIVVLLLLIAGIAFLVMRGGKSESSANNGASPTTNVSAETSGKAASLADYNGKKIGVQTGTVFDEMAKEYFPDSEISYYNTNTDLLTALKAGIIDAFIGDEPLVKYMMIEDGSVTYLKDFLDNYSFSFVFSKDDKGVTLCSEFSEYMKKIKSDGTLAEIDSLWFGTDFSSKIIPPLDELSAEKGTLTLAIESANAPFVYVQDNQIVGYEIDIAYRFCKEYGYGLELQDMDFTAIISSVVSGKCDFGASGMTITDERAQSINFSESDYDGGAVLAVRAEDVGGASPSNAAPAQTEMKLSDLDGKRIAIKTGTSFDGMVQKALPNAEISYFNTEADLLTALNAGTIDGFAVDEPVVKYMMSEDKSLDYVKEYMDSYEYAFAFPKNDEGKARCDELSEFIRKIKADGTLKEIDSIWFGTDKSKQVIPPLSELSGEKGTLRFAVEAAYAPFIFVQDNEIVGYEIDIAYRFCKEYGYGLELQDMDFTAIISSVVSGKCDFGASGMTITDERAQSINFSESDYDGGAVLAVRAEDVGGASPSNAAPAQTEMKLSDLDGKRIAIKTGTSFDGMVQKALPNAEISYFNTEADLLTALNAGTIDGFAVDEPVVKYMMSEDKSLDYVKEYMDSYEYAFAFPKNDEGKARCDELSEFIRKIKADGTLKEIDSIWFGTDKSKQVIPPLSELSGEKGTLRFAVEAAYAPFIFVQDNEIVGYEIDIAYRFCKEYGYGLELRDMDFGAIIPSILSGKCDFGAAGMTVTEERAESVNFTESDYEGGAVIAVRASDMKSSAPAASGDTAAADAAPSQPDYTEFNGKTIGILTGSSFEPVTLEKFPDSKYLYFDTTSDLVTALKSGKIDGFVNDEPTAKMIHAEMNDVSYLEKPLVVDNYAFGFSKESSAKFLSSFNEFLAKVSADGTMDAMEEKWFGSDEAAKKLDDVKFSGENGTIRAVGLADNAPFAYISNNEYVGCAVELMQLYASENGYDLKLEQNTVSGATAGIASGVYDVFIGSLSVTEERRESMDFSDTVYSSGMVLLTRTADIGSGDAASAPAAETAPSQPDYTEFNGKRLGIKTGSSLEPITFDKFPDSEYFYYDTDNDLLTALENNKIDAYLTDRPLAEMIHVEKENLDFIRENIVDDDYHIGFPKNSERSDKIRSQLNDFIAENKANGTFAEMKEKWFSKDDSVKVLDDSGLTGENGELVVATPPDNVPFDYVADNKVTGYVIEMITMFAREYGYSVKYEMTTYVSGLAGLASGKYDMFASALSYTEERAQSINFSDVYYNGGVVLMARTADLGGVVAPEAADIDFTSYNGKRMGIKTGSSFEPITFDKFPDSEYFYYDTDSDLIAALRADKIDGFLTDEPVAKMEHTEMNDIDYIKKNVVDDDYHFIVPKDSERGKKLQGELNEFIAEMWSSGEMDKMKNIWLGTDESVQVVDESGLTGENGEISVVYQSGHPPFSYTANNKRVGYAVDLMTRFARKYGYTLKAEETTIASGLAGMTSGKYDVFAGSISYTEERAKSVDYTDVIYNGGVVLMVRAADLAGGAAADNGEAAAETTSFFASIKESFNKNFIREDRYKLILEGIGTTCIITALSVLVGSVLAFLICLFRRADSFLANKICNLYVKLLQGTPMVVLLMILYYVVFGKSGLASIWVAVIGFSLNFAAYVSEILRSGIESIDGGQREAALALGYSENQAFFKFIFPQAAVRQIPVYRGEIISLLKNTSIVGYIAIQDLTKMSDIIRSRTYEAFFPLIVTAVIYFILAWIIALVLKIVLKRLDPRMKKRGVKGVKTI